MSLVGDRYHSTHRYQFAGVTGSGLLRSTKLATSREERDQVLIITSED